MSLCNVAFIVLLVVLRSWQILVVGANICCFLKRKNVTGALEWGQFFIWESISSVQVRLFLLIVYFTKMTYRLSSETSSL